LYSQDDLERVRVMQHHLAQGLAAAEAASLVTLPPPDSDTGGPLHAPAATLADLDEALSSFDESGAQEVLDSALAGLTLDTTLADVVVPFLRELGKRWERGEASIAQEHFASSILRGRLLGLARGWDRGFGPRIVLACAPGEQHDLGLIAFGLALRARGWRIVYLGADTPLTSVEDASRASDPVFVVVSAVNADNFRAHRAELDRLAAGFRLCIGGAGASGADTDGDVMVLAGDPVEEAERLTRDQAPR
jgi:methanogenic corrinoid protein MtbC1